MELTTGTICFCIGIIGSIVCVVMLCVMEKNWKRQRKRLLHIIETEE